MPYIAALSDDNAQRILDDIDRQFRPSLDTLAGLTREFLAEFKLGLDSSAQPMAMMFVSFVRLWDSLPILHLDPLMSPMCPMEPKQGERVMALRDI